MVERDTHIDIMPKKPARRSRRRDDESFNYLAIDDAHDREHAKLLFKPTFKSSGNDTPFMTDGVTFQGLALLIEVGGLQLESLEFSNGKPNGSTPERRGVSLQPGQVVELKPKTTKKKATKRTAA